VAPAGGNLRIGEHRGGHDGEGSLPGLAGVCDVVPDDLRFGVGHVLELEVVGEVAERPDPGDTRLAGVVGADVSVGVDVDSGCGDVETFAVRSAAGRHQQYLCLDPLRS
jgi:hypothetical protein